MTTEAHLIRLNALANYYDAQRDRYRNSEGDPRAEKHAANAADSASALRWAIVQVTPLDEPVLMDDYPVYPTYLYVADGKVIESPIEGNVGRLKACLNAVEIRRCDIMGRSAKKEPKP